MIEATNYPMDFDAISKGSVITVEEVEQIVGRKASEYEYGIKALALAQRVKQELSTRGIDAVVVQQRRGIRVLTDAEATEYNHREFNRRIVGMGRALHNQLRVDTSAFDTAQSQKHDRRVQCMGFIFAATTNARKAAKQLFIKSPDMPKTITASTE